jgi:uncharacterized protein (TIGR03437 family)
LPKNVKIVILLILLGLYLTGPFTVHRRICIKTSKGWFAMTSNKVILGMFHAVADSIFKKKIFGVLLLSAVCGWAAPANFLLGINYSEWLSPSSIVSGIATDGIGALYILSNTTGAPSTVSKLSADGKTIAWQNQLAFVANAMAVDPSGGVYVTSVNTEADRTVYVAKLSAAGMGLAWMMSAGFTALSQPVLTVDSQGRPYVTAQHTTNNFITQTADVVRVNTAGGAIDYTAQVMGIPSSIAVDATGAAYVAGTETNAQGVNTGFLAQVKPDGSTGFYSLFPLGVSQTVAVDGNRGLVLLGEGTLQRLDFTGTVKLSTPVATNVSSLALDAAGDVYIPSISSGRYPFKNSLAPCGSGPSPTQLLIVIAPDGSILQTTYIPGSDHTASYPLVATDANSTVFIVGTAGPSFAPTQAGPFPAGVVGGMFLSNFAPNSAAEIYPLVCVANAASLVTAAIAPGELVALFGNGLGPQQGIQTQATLQNPYPMQAAGVQVFFDGLAAPLLWVEDGQINAVAPWSLKPGVNTQICVSYESTNTDCLNWPVVQAAPAVFTVDGTYAAALNQDGTINSPTNRAPVGSIVTVFATGLGPVSPAQADGMVVGLPLPTNVLTVGVTASYTIGIPSGVPVNVPFEVQYAGPAPYQVAGVSQINFQVEPYASYGAIYLSVGTVNSPGFEIYVAGQ